MTHDPSDTPTAPRTSAGIGPVMRRVALTVAAVRYIVPLVAIPFIPLLIVRDLPLLILVRPTKEFLLLAGGSLRVVGSPSVALALAAYLPLMVVAVWAFFIVGRAYRDVLGSPDAPAWITRTVPPARLALARRVLEQHGPAIAVLGRIAALPPTVLAAAAGASEVDGRRYLAADLIGAFAAFALTFGAGWLLGEAFEQGGVLVTIAGVALFVALVALLTRWIRRAADEGAPAS